MARYKKLITVEIQAFRYDGDLMDSDGNYYVPDWAVKAFKDKVLYYHSDRELYIMGVSASVPDVKVSIGDYIVQDDQGDIYACNPMTFEDVYLKVIDV